MAAVNFTARWLAALKPPADGRAEYWDEGVPGFGIRISKTGQRSWFVMYRFDNRLKRYTIPNSGHLELADARAIARDLLHQVAVGVDPATQRRVEREADTFADLAAEFLERHAKPNKKSWHEDERIINKFLLPRWGSWKAKSVSRKDIIKFLDNEVQRGAPMQANKSLALIRKIYNFGIQRDIVSENPCLAVSLPAKPRSRDRVLSAEEIRVFWQALEEEDELIKAMFRLRLLTAQRGGEIEAMAWNEVDLESGWWVIPAHKAKNGLAHRVPLNKQALAVLMDLDEKRGSSPWVFPSPTDPQNHIWNIQKAIQRIRARAGYLDVVGHDLRRTAASHMASMGIPRLVISKILNHVETGVTAIYDRHSYDAEKRHALDLWGRSIEEILKESVLITALSAYSGISNAIN